VPAANGGGLPGSSDDDPRSAPPFVVVRGNSASGKSTVARRVQRALPRGEVAAIGQDHVRRELLWERDSGQGDTIGLLESRPRHCLGIGRITLLEGVFGADRYHAMFSWLLRDAPTMCSASPGSRSWARSSTRRRWSSGSSRTSPGTARRSADRPRDPVIAAPQPAMLISKVVPASMVGVVTFSVSPALTVKVS